MATGGSNAGSSVNDALAFAVGEMDVDGPASQSNHSNEEDTTATAAPEDSSAEYIAACAAEISATVPVKIGKDQVEFIIPEWAIRNVSPFFRAACSETWQSGKHKVVLLSEELPAAFYIFLQWLYTREIPDTWRVDKDTSGPMKWYLLASCWLLGDYILVPEFCNDIMATLMEFTVKSSRRDNAPVCFMHVDVITLVYSRTSDMSSPLRCMLVDSWVELVDNHKVADFMLAHSDSECQEFYSDVAFETIKLARKYLPRSNLSWTPVSSSYLQIDKDD